MKKQSLIILIIIVILGAALRLIFLSTNPPSLNWDEVSHGYNAYSIAQTGMDQWGKVLPIFNFRAYGDYPTTLNLYLTIPFLAVFGLTEFAIRFPHAILGILTIISVYFLSFGITKRKDISLIASLLVAIDPWYVFTSRFVLQSNLSAFLIITAGAAFFNREKMKWLLPFCLFLLTLTLFSYHTTRIFSPLILLGAVLIYRKEISNKLIYLFATLFIALSAYILVNPNATARGNVLFLVDQSAVNQIIESRQSSKLPSGITRLIYNRPTYFVKTFIKNYVSYFSPRFLFLKGGTQYQFSVPNHGLIYPVSMPFFYLGLMLLIIRSFRSKNYRLVLLWLILSPVPASLTNESYAVIRATTMLPIPEILISIGLYKFAELLFSKQKILIISIFVTVSLLMAGDYMLTYFKNYKATYSWSWQYGYKEVVSYAKNHYSDYDKIIVTKKYGEPHEFFLFYMKYDPAKYLNDSGKIAFFQSNWYWVDRFDKFYFINDWQVKINSPLLSSIQQTFVTESKYIVDCNNLRCLLITSPGNFPPGWKYMEEIDFLDGKPAFEIYANR
jgi:4-amino-4-deoxy-L-arabinose transferase-like glycosyltransferase